MNFRIQNLDSQVGLKTFKYYCIIRAPAIYDKLTCNLN